GRPHDRADALTPQVELEQRGCVDLGRFRARGRLEAFDAGLVGPRVEPVEQALEFEVGQPHRVGKTAGELHDAVADPPDSAGDPYTATDERPEVDVTAFR